MATYEELRADVEAAVREIDTSIALASLVRQFNEDHRIGPVFDNTYEARPFVLCRSSVEVCLALALIRCHDHQPNCHGLTAFFRLLDQEETKGNLREGIYRRRREWVGQEEARQDTADHLEELGYAQELHATLRGSHQYARVRDFRHTHVAHTARGRAQVPDTERVWLYELLDSSIEIVQLLCAAVLGVTEDFEGGSEIWEDYTRRFFDTLMSRADD